MGHQPNDDVRGIQSRYCQIAPAQAKERDGGLTEAAIAMRERYHEYGTVAVINAAAAYRDTMDESREWPDQEVRAALAALGMEDKAITAVATKDLVPTLALRQAARAAHARADELDKKRASLQSARPVPAASKPLTEQAPEPASEPTRKQLRKRLSESPPLTSTGETEMATATKARKGSKGPIDEETLLKKVQAAVKADPDVSGQYIADDLREQGFVLSAARVRSVMKSLPRKAAGATKKVASQRSTAKKATPKKGTTKKTAR